MKLHLVDSWNYLGRPQNVFSFGDGEVGEPMALTSPMLSWPVREEASTTLHVAIAHKC